MENPAEVTVMSKKELERHYKAAVQHLDDNYAFFLTHVLKIGKPSWSNIVPTAAVMIELLDKNGFLPGKKSDELDYEDFKFVFSPSFGSALSVEEMSFILAHETMHIVLNHLKLVESFVDREALKKAKKAIDNQKRMTRDEIRDAIVAQQNAMRFNIAADCVINDYLGNAGMDVPNECMKGKDKIGVDAAYLTVHEVYQMLKNQAQQNSTCPSCGGTGQKPEDDEEEKQEGDGSGNKSKQGESDEKKDGKGGKDKSEDKQDSKGDGEGKGEPCPDCNGTGKGQGGGGGMADEIQQGVGGTYEQLDSHDWMLDPDYAEKMADALDKLNEEVENQTGLPTDLQDKKDEEQDRATKAQQALNKSMRAGSQDGNMKDFIEQVGANLAWAKLLKEIDPDMFKEPGIAPPMVSSFHQRRRKLQGQAYKDVYLPVQRYEQRHEKETHEKPSIVLALDVSGSIGPRDAERFITLAKSIPTERIKLFCCTFQSSYEEIDPQNVHRFSQGGGTSFDAIANYIEARVKPELKGKYPKSVVVITDGQAALSTHLWPTEDEAKGWFWLISPQDLADGSYYRASLDIGRRAKLDDFIA
jgi:predicted metal-dependent peptidase